MTTSIEIFHYAKDGMLKLLCTSLNGVDPTELKSLLEAEASNSFGERLTPLIIAARNGHRKVVKLLIQRFGANVNRCGALRVDEILLDNVSPLWAAAGAGHIDIVKELINAGAEMDHRTDTGSTPIRAASFDGKYEVVKYLAARGADIGIANDFNNTCLMIASYQGHYDIVDLLLSHGADPNRQALCGATALHFAAEFGHGDIIDRLLQSGATVMKTNSGFTPLMLAAEQAREWVVQLFMNRPELHFTKREIIDAVELLGASYANDQKHYDLNMCRHYLKKGLRLRYKDPNDEIPKPPTVPIPAYENRKECQTLAELDSIANDANALHMESLIIRERLLGPKFTNETLLPVVVRGVLLAEEGEYDRCIALWLHRMRLMVESKACVLVSKEVQRFSMMFSRIVVRHHTIKMEDIAYVLSTTLFYVTGLMENIDKTSIAFDKDEIDEEKDLVFSAVLELLLIVASPGYTTDNPTALKQFKETLFNLIKLNVRLSGGKTLLHLACDPYTRICATLSGVGLKYPDQHVITMLLECGASINEVDDNKNTPLHLLVGPFRPVRDFADTQKMINILIDHGAHIDAVNSDGLEPIQAADSIFVQLILKTHCKVKPLSCLAAKVVNDHGLHAFEKLPPTILQFVEMHGCGD